MLFDMHPELDCYRVNIRTTFWTITYWLNAAFSGKIPTCTLTHKGVSILGFVRTNKGVIFADQVVKKLSFSELKESDEEWPIPTNGDKESDNISEDEQSSDFFVSYD
jgi:hypothetical protein